MTPEQAGRFWSKVNKESGRWWNGSQCWLWTAGCVAGGYGSFSPARGKTVTAHRFLYEQSVGPVPVGLELDHLCRRPGCVRPSHLEPVPGRVNILRGTSFSAVNARKTACKNGHQFTPENTALRPEGGRKCRTCKRVVDRESQRRHRRRRRAGEIPV